MTKGLYTISLSPEIAEKGKALAEATGTSFSGLIQGAIIKELKDAAAKGINPTAIPAYEIEVKQNNGLQ